MRDTCPSKALRPSSPSTEDLRGSPLQGQVLTEILTRAVWNAGLWSEPPGVEQGDCIYAEPHTPSVDNCISTLFT